MREGADFALDLRVPNVDLTIDQEHRGVYAGAMRLPEGVQRQPQRRERGVDSAKSKDVVGYIGVGSAVAVTGVVLLLTGESASRYDRPETEAASKLRRLAFTSGPGQVGLGMLTSF